MEKTIEIGGKQISYGSDLRYLLPHRGEGSNEYLMVAPFNMEGFLKIYSKEFGDKEREGVRFIINECERFLSLDESLRSEVPLSGIRLVPLSECDIPRFGKTSSTLKSMGVGIKSHTVEGVRRTKDLFERLL